MKTYCRIIDESENPLKNYTSFVDAYNFILSKVLRDSISLESKNKLLSYWYIFIDSLIDKHLIDKKVAKSLKKLFKNTIVLS